MELLKGQSPPRLRKARLGDLHSSAQYLSYRHCKSSNIRERRDHLVYIGVMRLLHPASLETAYKIPI